MLEKLQNEKKECTGCAACKNICPVGAIQMLPDEEGFYKPVIDSALCIHCNKCESVCPQLHCVKENDNNPVCYAVQASEKVREVSSSGGVFSILAEYIFDKGGYVCGAAYDEDYRSVSMIMINKRSDMEKLRGSKYVYAKPGNIYQQVKEKLESREYVLFSGTPCQVAALNNFLGKKYEKLLTVDFLCGGVNSEKVYNLYLDEIAQGRTIKNVCFRPKKYGWDYCGIEITFEENDFYYRPLKDSFHKGHLKWLYAGNSCAECTYAEIPRQGDFSMGDFWQIKKFLPDVDADKGISCLLINNNKAENILEEIEKWMHFKHKVPLSFLKRHNRMQEKRAPHLARSRFFNLISEGMKFSKAVDYAVNWKFDVALTGCWTVRNYGGELTYYALYKTLKSMGYETLMVERRLDIPGYDIPKPSVFRNNPYPYYDVCRIHKNFKDQWELNNRVESFICGSDQIWNYELMGADSIRSYTMDYVADWRKKITYASSFGGNKIKGKAEETQELEKLIKRLNYVSVREKGGKQICENIGVKAEWVIDPVFLCDKKEYHKLCEKVNYKVQGDYLFTYFIFPDRNKYGIDRFAGQLKCDYIGTVNAGTSFLEKVGFSDEKWPYPYIEHIKIEDWINYLIHARFIVTDSFHATCFAIMYRIPFVFIQGTMTENGGFARLSSILETLNLMDRVVPTVEEALRNKKYLEPINYDAVHEILDKEIVRCKEWLRNAIESEL